MVKSNGGGCNSVGSNGVRACTHFGADKQGTEHQWYNLCILELCRAATMGFDTPHGGTIIGIYNIWWSYDTYDFASRSRSLERGSLHLDHGVPVETMQVGAEI